MTPNTHRADGDYYALLGLEKRFAIDPAELERSYRDVAKETHPDRFVNAEAAVRIAAVSRSMAVNQAYKTLRKPQARAEYLLSTYGLGLDGVRVPNGFLVEILEKREELAEAKESGDDDRLRALEREMEERKDSLTLAIPAEFLAYESTGDSARLARVQEILVELRYVDRYLEALDGDDDEEE